MVQSALGQAWPMSCLHQNESRQGGNGDQTTPQHRNRGVVKNVDTEECVSASLIEQMTELIGMAAGGEL
jgi:hypothetical protein